MSHTNVLYDHPFLYRKSINMMSVSSKVVSLLDQYG